ncbi:MAG: NADH dehydrogenase subunit I [Syntrophorhabdaceae bacterium PtaU1.Bin034]|jgi:formate dehydrogenase subunit beta|nr:MAG: NADH dehydrogenase subunit I [Syntrophorhabdaceae bacterium PtaU1.Bin034]
MAKPLKDLDAALNRFLHNEHHLVFGFAKDKDIRHRIFKGSIDDLALLNPTFDINGALYLRRLFSKGQMILLLRPCEIRAYQELTKLTQVEKEGITAISVDCFGAVSSKDKKDVPTETDQIKDYFKDPSAMRYACRVCRERRGIIGDAGIRFDKAGNLWAIPYTPKGEAFLSLLPGDSSDAPEMLLAESPSPPKFQTSMEEFAKDFSSCIMCKNCRDMCPVCYCIDCLFNGDEYLPKGDALLHKVFRTGSTSLPSGKELFHLIRMYHVSQVCVGCGSCEEACPQGIPLTKYFKGTSERLQGIFSYMAGRDETIPYLTFEEDELHDAED